MRVFLKAKDKHFREAHIILRVSPIFRMMHCCGVRNMEIVTVCFCLKKGVVFVFQILILVNYLLFVVCDGISEDFVTVCSV